MLMSLFYFLINLYFFFCFFFRFFLQAFLTVVAEDPVGAKALLQVGIMTKLSQAQFLDLRPEHELQMWVQITKILNFL